jgi:hypothetical protein
MQYAPRHNYIWSWQEHQSFNQTNTGSRQTSVTSTEETAHPMVDAAKVAQTALVVHHGDRIGIREKDTDDRSMGLLHLL